MERYQVVVSWEVDGSGRRVWDAVAVVPAGEADRVEGWCRRGGCCVGAVSLASAVRMGAMPSALAAAWAARGEVGR